MMAGKDGGGSSFGKYYSKLTINFLYYTCENEMECQSDAV